MKKTLTSFFILFYITNATFSKDELYRSVSTIVCKCITEAETNSDSIIDGTKYKTCFTEAIKPYKKEIKRLKKTEILEDKESKSKVSEFYKTRKEAIHDFRYEDDEYSISGLLDKVGKILTGSCSSYSKLSLSNLIFFE